jgi:thiol-disulfide isomerase/thioredoxin
MKQYAFGTASLLLSVVAFTAFAQSPTPLSTSALGLLERTSHHYTEAKFYHLESVEERTSNNDFQRSWQKLIFTAAEAPDNRYHYEGHTGFGSAMEIGNGKTVWTYHFIENTYTERSLATSVTSQPRRINDAEIGVIEARNLRGRLGELAQHYKSATRLPDEVVTMKGQSVSCYVILLRAADRKRADPDYASEKTLWIDKTREVIVKTVEHAHTNLRAGTARIPIEEEITTSFPVAQLDEHIPASLFTFVPPREAKLVEHFPDPQKEGDLTGEPMPTLQMKSADGALVSLDLFRGKPVLVELWATWCAPCVKGLARLGHIYRDAKDKGLVVISVDEDEEAKTAADFLMKNDYAWQNFHDGGEIIKSLGSSRIPRTILVNSQGRVVYDDAGQTEEEVRSAVARLGPEYASLAPKTQQTPCVTAK